MSIETIVVDYMQSIGVLATHQEILTQHRNQALSAFNIYWQDVRRIIKDVEDTYDIEVDENCVPETTVGALIDHLNAVIQNR